MNLKYFSLAVCAFLFSCEQPSKYVSLSGPTMGTHYQITLQPTSSSDIQQLHTALQAELQDINLLMSTYIDNSEINRFNRLVDGSCFAFSDKSWQVLLAAQKVYQQSDGAFDITMGPLISRWGFNAEEYSRKVPSVQEVSLLRDQTGGEKLNYDLNNQCIQKSAAKVGINLSAIAKGFAVDQLAAIIKNQNIDNYLVNIGGEVKAEGLSPKQKSWAVAVEKPTDLQQQGSIVVLLKNNSIATSGDYRNYFEVNGTRFSHTIDPKTGYPVKHDLASVSVIHASNMYADAYATAITVLGADKGMHFAQEQQLAIYTIQRSADSLSVNSSPEFDKYTPKSK